MYTTTLRQELASQQVLSQRLQASSRPRGRGRTRSTTLSEVQDDEQDEDVNANGDDDTDMPVEPAPHSPLSQLSSLPSRDAT